VKSPEIPGGLPPEFSSGRGKPRLPDSNDAGRDETTGQTALRLLMMMVGSAGLAADRSLFSTILASYAKKGKAGEQAAAIFKTQTKSKLGTPSQSGIRRILPPHREDSAQTALPQVHSAPHQDSEDHRKDLFKCGGSGSHLDRDCTSQETSE
jgi:hypothetical protein